MELIVHNKWKGLCDVEYSPTNSTLPPDGSVVFCHMEHVPDFINLIKHTDNQYVLVSADSDYCFTYQANHPVWADMQKWFSFTKVDQSLEYQPALIPARCDVSQCRLSDAYSVKVYSYTKNTIEYLPENIVAWFTTNCDINIPGIYHIPFGIPHWNVDSILQAREKGLHKNPNRLDKVYVNLQLNTLQRVDIVNFYRHVPYATVETNISHEDFIKRLLEYKYVVSPSGNGFDCFRTLEAIYCGATPIISNKPFNSPYFPLQVVVNDGMMPAQISNEGVELEGTPADMQYWRDRIRRVKSLC